MIVSTTHCARIGQTIALLYAFIAILYTTNYLLASPLRACFSLLFNLPTSTTLPNSSVSSILHSLNKQNFRKPQVSPLFWDTKASRPSESSWPADIDNDLVLSKAFSSSMHPSKIVPFFYRASGELDAEDITITTLITSNRFPVFARLVERYQGVST